MAGRPMKFTSAEHLSQLVEEYFQTNDKPTLSGLALALGMDRKTLFNYGKKDLFFPIVKEARERVEAVYEERLIYSDKPTGVIFALKNMDWKDRHDHTTDDRPFPTPIIEIPSPSNE
jgi:hypothetical protein